MSFLFLLSILFVSLRGGLSIAQATDLDIIIGGRTVKISSQSQDSRAYFRLSELAAVFKLELREGNGQITVIGSRGSLNLVAGRPLASLGDQYVLLSSAVWQPRRGEWYVPGDFLEKALPGILNQKLTRVGASSFRVDSLDVNRVRVEVLSYPDHLSVVFTSDRQAPVRVREYRKYLEVAFAEYLVQPDLVSNQVATGLVTSVTHQAQEGMGTFRVMKGDSYRSFREYRLLDPPRLVLDIYGADPSAEEQVADRPLDSPSDSVIDRREVPSDRPAPMPLGGGLMRERFVVIDPGHGGADYGVDVQLDTLEKVLALNLSRRIRERLQERGEKARLTRFRDVALPAEQRSAITNFYAARLFVGIHAGGAPSPETKGPLVYVYEPDNLPGPSETAEENQTEEGELVPWGEAQKAHLDESRRLARLMQAELNRLFGSRNSVAEVPLATLAPIKAPAIVIEAGFLTNPDDLALLTSVDFQDQLADVVAATIIRFARTL